MPGNSFGKQFRITSFGESHGGAVGCVIDGCPPGLEITEKDIQEELDRRRPGQSDITTPRKESDTIEILSGVFEGQTTGTPIALMANNKDARSADYEEMKDTYRPSHADYTYEQKYGLRDWRGGGRSSARETLARVAAGAVARKFLREKLGVDIVGCVSQVGTLTAEICPDTFTRAEVEATPIRCPDKTKAKEMISLIDAVRDEGDSLGGVVLCTARGVPVGLGEPVFDKLHADLAKAMVSINAVKGFEIGSGFSGVSLKGSEHNDPFELDDKGDVRASTNNAGGVLGGISSGETIYFRVAFKPTSTIQKEQSTVTSTKKKTTLAAKGRHDPCVLPRAVPIVEAMTALVLMDHYLRHRGQTGDG